MSNKKNDIKQKGLLNILDELYSTGKFQKIAGAIVIFLVIIHLLAFGIPIVSQSYGKPYAKAKSYATAATTINIIYIFPLSKAFGYKNIFTLPFYSLRDYLYNKSISLYPVDEGGKRNSMVYCKIR